MTLQLLDAGGEGDAGQARGLDVGALVHRYGRSFVHSAPDVALEYYMQARRNPILLSRSGRGVAPSALLSGTLDLLDDRPGGPASTESCGHTSALARGAEPM